MICQLDACLSGTMLTSLFCEKGILPYLNKNVLPTKVSRSQTCDNIGCAGHAGIAANTRNRCLCLTMLTSSRDKCVVWRVPAGSKASKQQHHPS